MKELKMKKKAVQFYRRSVNVKFRDRKASILLVSSIDIKRIDKR